MIKLLFRRYRSIWSLYPPTTENIRCDKFPPNLIKFELNSDHCNDINRCKRLMIAGIKILDNCSTEHCSLILACDRRSEFLYMQLNKNILVKQFVNFAHLCCRKNHSAFTVFYKINNGRHNHNMYFQ